MFYINENTPLSTTHILDPLKENNQEVFQQYSERVLDHLNEFATSEITPHLAFDLETTLQDQLRGLARNLLQNTYNHLEPKTADQAQHDVIFDNSK